MKFGYQRDMLMTLLNDVGVSKDYKKAVRWSLCVIDDLIRDNQQKDAAIKAKNWEIEQLDFANQVAAKQMEQVREDGRRAGVEFNGFLESLRTELTRRIECRQDALWSDYLKGD
jgi:hypothetical protein